MSQVTQRAVCGAAYIELIFDDSLSALVAVNADPGDRQRTLEVLNEDDTVRYSIVFEAGQTVERTLTEEERSPATLKTRHGKSSFFVRHRIIW